MTPIIKGIKLKDLRKGEYSQLMTDVAKIIEINDPIALQVQTEYNELVALSEGISFFFRKKRGNDLTPAVAAADHRRDLAVTGIHGVVQGYLHHFDPATKAAAQLLADNMEHFGTAIAQKNYMSETTIVRAIATNWQTLPDLVAAANVLHLAPWVAEMEAANKAFDNMFISRITDMAKAPKGNMQQQRQLTDKAYYKLRNRLLALGNVNEYADPWGITIKSWNNLAESYSRLLKSHSSNQQNTHAEVNATPPPDHANDEMPIE